MNYVIHHEKLKAAREQLGYTQAQVAKRIGLCSQQYSRMERGLRQIRLNHLKILCDFLHIPLKEVLESAAEIEISSVTETIVTLDEQLSEVILCLSFAKKRVMLRTGQALIEEM